LDSKPKNFFKFEFITLPHKVYCPKDFEKETENLRGRLDSKNENFIFSHLEKEKNVPSDGLKHYFQQIWSDIQNEKDLNIPTQKEMLADYRCNEIKTNVLNESEQKIKELLNSATLGDMPDFKEKVLDLTNLIISEYSLLAKNYLKEKFDFYLEELKTQLSQRFNIAFVNQTKRLIPTSQKLFRSELEEKLNESKENIFFKKDFSNIYLFFISYKFIFYFLFFIFSDQNFLEVSGNVKKFYLENLINKLNTKKAFDSWKISENEYEELFNEIIESLKKIKLDAKKKDTFVKINFQ
jgi:hypothetical protein